MEISTNILRSRDELMQAIAHAGFIYTPVSDNYDDSGELSWPKAYEAAKDAAATGDLNFGDGLPCTIGEDTVHIMTIDEEVLIADIFRLTTAQVIARMATFVAGAYWSDVATG